MGGLGVLLVAAAAANLAIGLASWRLGRRPRPCPRKEDRPDHVTLNNDEVTILCVLLEGAVAEAEHHDRRLELAVLGDMLHRLVPLSASFSPSSFASPLPRSIRLGKTRDAVSS